MARRKPDVAQERLPAKTAGFALAAPAPAAGHEVSEGFGAIVRRQNAEIASIGIAARVRAEVEAEYIMAARMPRSEDDVRVDLLERCKDPHFAQVARYSRPVGGGKNAVGFSIRFAEEFMRLWGNLRAEIIEIYDDEEKKVVQIVVRDLQTNFITRREVTLMKTVERRDAKNREVLSERLNTQGETVFLVRATEDEMLNKESQWTQKYLRQLVLRMVPAGLKAECDREINATMRGEVKKDPESERKKVLDAFHSIGVPPKELAVWIEQDVKTLSPAQVIKLRETFTAIKEGHTSWAQVRQQKFSMSDQEDSGAGQPEQAGRTGSAGESQPTLDSLIPGDASSHTQPGQTLGKPKK